MDLVIITGMSGAGKSSALRIFEDKGYYCMDNLPPQLMEAFLDLVRSSTQVFTKVSIGVDIRGREFFDSLNQVAEKLRKEEDIHVQILFLDARDDVLVRRYKELRRPHPMDKAGNIYDGIQREKAYLKNVKAAADSIVDTSDLTLGQLKEALDQLFADGTDRPKLMVTIYSFGFKHGILLDGDLIFDVRFLPNPFYVDSLKHLTGCDPEVRDFLRQYEAYALFMDKTMDLLDFLLPLYIKEGKRTLTIGLGCTGGRHRSAAMAEELAERMKAKGWSVQVRHRDQRFWK